MKKTILIGILICIVLSLGVSAIEFNWTYYPKNGFITPTSQIITFKANNLSNYTIVWGTTLSYGNTKNKTLSKQHYDIILESLTADTTYFYNLTIINSTNNISWASNFTTMPETNRNFSFCFFESVHVGANDFKTNTEARFRKYLRKCVNSSVDFIVFGGDTIEGLSSAEAKKSYQNLSLILKDEVPHIPILAVTGNHDPGDGAIGSYLDFREFFTNPQNGEGIQRDGAKAYLANETVWAFNYSYGCFGGKSDYLNLTNASTQYDFINSTIFGCNNDTNWFKAVFSHEPINGTLANNPRGIAEEWNRNIYQPNNALNIVGHYHSAGINISLKEIRISPVFNQFTCAAFPGLETDEWNECGTAHFGIINVTSTVAIIEIYNDSLAITQTILWNNTALLAADTTPPTYTLFQNNASATLTGTGDTVNFSVDLADNVQLSTYRFAHNQSGTLTNGTSVDISGTSFSVTEELTVTLFSGENICGQFFFNDTSGNTNNTNLSCFTVESTDPVISSIATQPISDTSASITWTTNENANTTVDYGTISGSLDQVSEIADSTTSHSRGLTNLNRLTQYFYTVTSCDASQNCATSSETSFITIAVTGSTSNILRNGVAVLLAIAILSVFMLPLLTKTDLSVGLIITMLVVFIIGIVAISFIFGIT